jgi:RNA polymerase sigma-70 factor, ECF subfamily
MPADAWAVQFPVGKYVPRPAITPGVIVSRETMCGQAGAPPHRAKTERDGGPGRGTAERGCRELAEREERNSGTRELGTRSHMLSQSRIDDTVLVREAQRGSRAAFEELVRHYDQAVLRLALHLTGSQHEAQDIYQDAFLKAYKNIGRFRFECSFYTWIYRIVTNLCLDNIRKKQVRKEEAPVATDPDGEVYDVLSQVADGRSGANPEHDLMRRELGGKIARALEKLTPRERMVFELKHYQGLKLRTVGEMLNTTEETAKNTLFRATQKLRASLGEMR